MYMYIIAAYFIIYPTKSLDTVDIDSITIYMVCPMDNIIKHTDIFKGPAL